MNEYLITNKTLAILPYLRRFSVILEVDNIILINKNPIKIINFNCNYHGSSYLGNLSGSSYLTGLSYKLPISIDNNYVFFPTTSPRNKACSWINLFNVLTVKKRNKDDSNILFINNKSINFNISCNKLNHQLLQAYYLAAKIKQNRV